MSTYVTVHSNRAQTRKGKILLTDLEVLKKNEIQRRRALRLLQVRQQCKDIASQIRERCKDEKNRQLHFYELDLKEELRENEVMRQAMLHQQYQRCLSSVGQSHRDAAAQPDPEIVMMMEQARWKKEATKRGEVATKLNRAQAAKSAQKQKETANQRNFVRTVENIRSSVVAALPKNVLQSPERSKNKEVKLKKVPLRDVNKIPVAIPQSSDVFTCRPTHLDVPPLQGVASQSSSSISLSSVSQRPPCVDKFVNKLSSRRGRQGSTVESLSSILPHSEENRSDSLSTHSLDTQTSKFVYATQSVASDQEGLPGMIEEKRTTTKNVAVSSPSLEGFAEDLMEGGIHMDSGICRPSKQKSSSPKKEIGVPHHKDSLFGETLLTESLKQVDGALKRRSDQRRIEQHVSKKVTSKGPGDKMTEDLEEVDDALKGSSEQRRFEQCDSKKVASKRSNVDSVSKAARDIKNVNKGAGSPSLEEVSHPNTSNFFSRLPTVWNESVSNRSQPSRLYSLDVIEEEKVDEEPKSEADVMVDAKKQMQAERNQAEYYVSKEQIGQITDYGSNADQTQSCSSQTSSHRVQLYDHTHRFKHAYDAATSISVTRVMRDGETDARAEATAMEVAAAAVARARVATVGVQTAMPVGDRGREALHRLRMEREYQNLLSALGQLSREERISRTVAGLGDPVEAHISDARLKERQAERQNVIASAFQNVVGGNAEALAFYKSPTSPPVNLHVKPPPVHAAGSVADGQENEAQLTEKRQEPESPAAALNVGMWTSLPVSSREPMPVISMTLSPKSSSAPPSDESSIILVPPAPLIPSRMLSPVREVVQSVNVGTTTETEHTGEAVPSADQVQEPSVPSVRDLEALEGLLERVRNERQQLLVSAALEPTFLPPLPPSPPPPTAAPGAADSAAADVSGSSVEAQSQSPPPPPLPPHAVQSRSRHTHRSHHSRHRSYKHGESQEVEVDAKERRTFRKEKSSQSVLQQQLSMSNLSQTQSRQQQPGSQQLPSREEDSHKGSRRDARRGDDEREDEDVDRGHRGHRGRRDRPEGRRRRSRSAAAATSLSPPAHELSVDVSVKSEGSTCRCYNARDADAMRLRVSVLGDSDNTGSGDFDHHRHHGRRHHRHHHHKARGPCDRRTCPRRKPPPPMSSGDSQAPGPPSDLSSSSSPSVPSRSSTTPTPPQLSPARPPPSHRSPHLERSPSWEARSATGVAGSPTRMAGTPTRMAGSPTRTAGSPARTRRSRTRSARSQTRAAGSSTRAPRGPTREAHTPSRKSRSASGAGQKRPKATKQSQSTRLAHGKPPPSRKGSSPARKSAVPRSSDATGPAPAATLHPRPPCWYERLGRTPPWPAEDSASTMYLSPPEQMQTPVCAHLDSLVGVLHCRTMPVVVCVDGKNQQQQQQQQGDVPEGPAPLDPRLERYVTRLLAMSQANVDALNVSSSDVSLRSDVVDLPSNKCHIEVGAAAKTQASAPTTASSPKGGDAGDSPGRRSVGVAVSSEQLRQPCGPCAPCARLPPEPCVELRQPCSPCAPCARLPPEPCVAPRPKTPPPEKRRPERSCSPVCPPVCAVHPAKQQQQQQQRKSRSPVRIPICAVAASRQATHRSCSPVCHPSCAAPSARQPEQKASSPVCPTCGVVMSKHPPQRSCSPVCPPSCAVPRSAAAVNSSDAPLDTTEYLQHDLFTRVAFRRVPASAPPCDPAVAHISPDYRALAAPKPTQPLRVGGGARGAESSPSTPSDVSSPRYPCRADATSCPVSAAPCAMKDAQYGVAVDIAEISERCERRIRSLARLIEHVRQEKNDFTHIQANSRDSSPVDTRTSLPAPTAALVGATLQLSAPPRVTKPTPTRSPVDINVPKITPALPSPEQEDIVITSPEPPNVHLPPSEDVGRTETWSQRSRREQSAPWLARKQPPSQSPPQSAQPFSAPPASSPQRSPPSHRTPSPQRSSPSHRVPSPPPPVSSSQRPSLHPASSPKHSPRQTATSPQRSPASTPRHSSVQPALSPRRSASAPPSSPPRIVYSPDVIILSLPEAPGSPPASPSRSWPAALQRTAQEREEPPGEEAEPIWMFTPGNWPPHGSMPCAPAPCERAVRTLRPKPPPSAWRPGVPYVEQHELSAIPEADSSQTTLVPDASERRSPTPPAVQRGGSTETDETEKRLVGPRENLHGLLVASHLAAREVTPWTLQREYFPPRAVSPCPRSPQTSPCAARSSCDFPCSTSPPPCASAPRGSPPCSRSPCPLSPHSFPPRSRSRSRSPPLPCPGAPCAPCAPCASSSRDGSPVQRSDEDDPDIVAELMRRGVLRSPFSWMKNADTRAQLDVDIDVSIVSGASSDFVSDLVLSASSSTPRKAPSSSPESPEQQYRRQRGGADQPQEATSTQHLADLLHRTTEDSSALGESLPEDLEGMFERLGLGWAASMLRKTQEAMAISSSSSETSRGASRPSGGGGGGGNESGGGGGVAGTSSVLRRGHSTPADDSAASDRSDGASWTRGQVVFTGDSDMSSVTGVSSRDLSTPSVSLAVKSKNKSHSRT